MKTDEKVKLKFLGINFVNVHFDFIQNLSDSINLSMDISIKINAKQENFFQVEQTTSLHIENGFYLSINSIGKFELSDKIEDEVIKKNLITINAPAIVFPYIRAFISTLTANLGDSVISKINIPPQFFSSNIPIIESHDI